MEIEQPAFVLHTRPYRETSLLVTFFTPDYGKFNAVVRGARSGRKTGMNKSAVLQPFQQLTVQWREKRQKASDLVSLQQFELGQLRFPLSGEASICGLYLNEVLYRLLYPHVAINNLFEHYQQALYQLLSVKTRAEQSWVLRQFEYQLLEELGHGFVCDQDWRQQPIDSNANYFFYPETGAVNVTEDSLRNGVAISGQALLTMANGQYCEACLPELKRLFREVLNLYLGNKPIMARQLFVTAQSKGD